ncbi:hypothetical protein ACFQ6C_26210 [Streptomyces sp. NPDC056454]|uniref:hypothetical protein n=1 Tax=Streptomyces sp. NPDC056454 TaxID=3345823 RepID=UPI00368262D6
MGNQVDQAQVRLLIPGSTELFPDMIYAEATGGATRTNPWTIDTGEVDFYLDSPSRVQIGILVSVAAEEFWNDVDVLAVNSDSSHLGVGQDSTQVGLGASSSGEGATALGGGATATAPLSTAIGRQASSEADGGLAVGAHASASQTGAIAVGRSSVSDGTQSTAVGDAARALHDRGVAIGAGAETTRPRQVMLGTAESLVQVPGIAVLHSPDGTPFVLRVTNEGGLYTQQLAPYEELPNEEGLTDG